MHIYARTLICGLAFVLVLAAPASAGTLKKSSPKWLTSSLKAELANAGAEGVQVSEERLNTECPGYQSPGVGAAGCIVAPYGCTANFIFGGSGNYHIGTAGHCSDKAGDVVTMQVDTTTLADVGTVVKRTNHAPGDGVPGDDFTLIRLDPAVVAEWGVNPAIPFVGGPNGVYSGCGPEPVLHYGHGYGVAVGQGKVEAGLATNWYDDGYGWTGFGAPGDSGSPVVTASGQGAGNFTHLIVNPGAYPGSDLAGTRLSKIIGFAGLPVVNANGSTSGAPSTNCGNQPN